MRHKQQGMTLIGWVCVISIILLLALAAIRLAPVYLQYLRIADVIRDVPAEMQNEKNVSPANIRKYIDKRFDVEAVTVIAAKDVKVERKNEGYILTADYDHTVPFLSNVNFLVEFKTTSTVRR